MNFYVPSTIAVAIGAALGIMVFGYTVKAYVETAG